MIELLVETELVSEEDEMELPLEEELLVDTKLLAAVELTVEWGLLVETELLAEVELELQ